MIKKYTLMTQEKKVLGYFDNIIGLNCSYDIDIDETTEYYPLTLIGLVLNEPSQDLFLESSNSFPKTLTISVNHENSKPILFGTFSDIILIDYSHRNLLKNEVDLMFGTTSATNAIDKAKTYLWDYIREPSFLTKNFWINFDSTEKNAWLELCMDYYMCKEKTEDLTGLNYTLDGSNIIDEASFYIALGNSLLGIGGYIGWNWNAFKDALTGSFGVKPPFFIHWENSSISKSHLEQITYIDSNGILHTFWNDVKAIFERKGITVEYL